MYGKRLAAAAILATLAVAFHARAVTLCTAGNPDTTSVPESTPTSAFVNHGDGTITHGVTGLMWKRCPQGLSGANCATGTVTSMTWSAALATAVADTTAGHGDWRLPNWKELASIVETCGYGPAINQTLFPATPASGFWASSSYFPDATAAWTVGFINGESGGGSDKTVPMYTRLVRGGRSLDTFDANHPLQLALDIDGNGTADALTDGILVVRYLMGLRGAALIQGAVGAGAARTSATEIEAHLLSVLPQN